MMNVVEMIRNGCFPLALLWIAPLSLCFRYMEGFRGRCCGLKDQCVGLDSPSSISSSSTESGQGESGVLDGIYL